MTDKDISATLNILNGFIEAKKYELGIDESKLRVCIGRKLATEIMYHLDRYLIVEPTIDEEYKIFGIPIEIENNDDMCLEVHIVEKVPVIKAGGLDE